MIYSKNPIFLDPSVAEDLHYILDLSVTITTDTETLGYTDKRYFYICLVDADIGGLNVELYTSCNNSSKLLADFCLGEKATISKLDKLTEYTVKSGSEKASLRLLISKPYKLLDIIVGKRLYLQPTAIMLLPAASEQPASTTTIELKSDAYSVTVKDSKILLNYTYNTATENVDALRDKHILSITGIKPTVDGDFRLINSVVGMNLTVTKPDEGRQ